MSNEENYFASAPEPPTPIGRRRALAPKASVHVSPLCLGAMTIGDQYHKIGFGEMTKDMSFKLLDTYFDAWGNFIDIANN
jgi:aryl-alcohol dehydrogenase-like predicted oxidoreductase